MSHYTKAPLPFVGQKRNFINPFKQALNHIPADGAGWTIVDAFGGSGLLAHVAKHTGTTISVPNANFTELSVYENMNRLENLLIYLSRIIN